MSNYTKDFAKNAIKKAENNVIDCDVENFIVNIKRATEQAYVSLYENDDRETFLDIDEKAQKLIGTFKENCSCYKK